MLKHTIIELVPDGGGPSLWAIIHDRDNGPSVPVGVFGSFELAEAAVELMHRCILQPADPPALSDLLRPPPAAAPEGTHAALVEEIAVARDLLQRVALAWKQCAIYGFACGNQGAVKQLLQAIQDVKTHVGLS